MSFYKAINSNSKIIDVYLEEELFDSYVKMDPNLNIPVRCSASDSFFGILSSDSRVIYSLGEQTGDYELVTLKAFEGQGEYDYLKAEIEAQRQVDYDEDEEDQKEDEIQPGSPTRAELQAQISQLTDALLELADMVLS